MPVQQFTQIGGARQRLAVHVGDHIPLLRPSGGQRRPFFWQFGVTAIDLLDAHDTLHLGQAATQAGERNVVRAAPRVSGDDLAVQRGRFGHHLRLQLGQFPAVATRASSGA